MALDNEEASMLDPRVRDALVAYQQDRVGLEATAQLLAQVQRETGCLELHASPGASPAERALLARFAALVADGGEGAADYSAPVV
jgi:hypothetical protein